MNKFKIKVQKIVAVGEIVIDAENYQEAEDKTLYLLSEGRVELEECDSPVYKLQTKITAEIGGL
jgi:hypothetical protein